MRGEQYNRYGRKHYENNKEYYIAKAEVRRKAAHSFVRNLKHNQPCMDCRVAYPFYVMQYDHRPGEKKSASIGHIGQKGWSQKRILEELAKCDLVCANCHMDRTHQRRQKAP